MGVVDEVSPPFSLCTHFLRTKQGAAFDDGSRLLESGLADLFVLVAIVAHIQVHGVIAGHNGSQQLAVTLARRLLILLYRRTAFALAGESLLCDKELTIGTFYLIF